MPKTSPSKPYRVGRSRTGLGLFATQPIGKGEKIIRYTGRMLDCNKKKDDAVENKYLFQITKRWTVDGSVRSNIARYINHACRPNAESDVSKKKLRIVIRAIKNIRPGDEINYDYGTEYFKEFLKPIGCKCDSCEAKRKKKRAAQRAAKAEERMKAKARAEREASKRKTLRRAKSAEAESAKAETAKANNAKTEPATAKTRTVSKRAKTARG